jgi:hypothetical protein
MHGKLDNKQKATLLEVSDVANVLAEAPEKLAEGLQYFMQVMTMTMTMNPSQLSRKIMKYPY